MHKSTFLQDDKKNWVNFQSRTLYVCESRHRRAGGALGFLIAAQVAHTNTQKSNEFVLYYVGKFRCTMPSQIREIIVISSLMVQ